MKEGYQLEAVTHRIHRHIAKIREKLLRACKDLEVNMVELESNIDSIYEENITTKKFKPL